MKKLFMALVMSAVMALSAGMLVGCGGNDEELIREALTQELDSIKNQDSEFTASMASSMGGDEIQQLGINTDDFVASYLDGFDYTIGDIAVDGEKATAQVTMTCKSYAAFMDAVDALATSMESDPAVAEMTTNEEIYTYMGSKMMEALNGVSVAECPPVTVEYDLIDGEWTPTAESEQAITNAMLGN